MLGPVTASGLQSTPVPVTAFLLLGAVCPSPSAASTGGQGASAGGPRLGSAAPTRHDQTLGDRLSRGNQNLCLLQV